MDNFQSMNPRTSRIKTAATLTIAVLGSLAVSYLVFSNLPAETEFIVTKLDNQTLQDLYTGWKKSQNIIYHGKEDDFRIKVFAETYETIVKENAKNNTYTLGLNQFSAMTNEEFSSLVLGYSANKQLKPSKNSTRLPVSKLKESVDWTTNGTVTQVKTQGLCGACWAFSATGALEGLFALQGKLQEFSEQELIDCTRSYGNRGCNGGFMDFAFRYVRDKGISLQSAYRYKGIDASCKKPAGQKFKISGYANVPANSPAQLKAAIAKQPVSVAVHADSSVFRNYKKGVVTGSACGTNINHAVLAVGYDTSKKTPYYKVKNSWGTSWGDKGFIKIGIQEGAGVCGIQKYASYPIA